MKKYLILSLLVLASCKDYTGQWSVNDDLQLQTQKGVEVIPAGTYSGEVELKNKQKLKLEFKSSNFKKKLEILIPDIKIPSTEGDFFIPASESGQAYDIQGSLTTVHQNFSTTCTSRECTRSSYMDDEPIFCEPNRYSCDKEITDSRLAITIFAPNTKDVKATFSGRYYSSSTTSSRTSDGNDWLNP